MRILLILTVVATIFIVGCSKEKSTEVQKQVKQTDLEELNNFRPDEDKLASVYHSFAKEIKPNVADYKSAIEPVDRPLDETVWLLNATSNTELGFQNDSIEELFFDTLQIVLNNKSINNEGIPVIDGNEIVSIYTDFKNSVEQNSSQGFLLWATKVEVIEISDEESEIEFITAGGPKGSPGYWKLLPPGVDPTAFPSGTSYSMAQAALAYEIKVHYPDWSFLGPGWIIEFYNSFPKSWYIGPGNFDNRIAHHIGKCNNGMLSGTTLNNYLFSTKDVIDENNPNGANDFIVGYLTLNCWNFPWTINGHWSEHIIGFYIYKLTYVGLPG